MPVEIRELIIKTEITGTTKQQRDERSEWRIIQELRQMLAEDCRRLLAQQVKKGRYNR